MSAPVANLFLSSLSSPSRDQLLARAIAVPLPLKTLLYRAAEPAPFAYFLTSGIASVVTAMIDGGSAEVGMIGNEGLVGALHVLGNYLPPSHCMIQMQATGLRIPMGDLREAFRASEEIRNRILEVVQEQALTLGQVAGCNRLHPAEERLARWLLMVQDRAHADTFDLTQELLAEMLGSRRTTVTLVAGTLQRSGLIEYERGRITILNREGLEAAACSCYPLLKQFNAALYEPRTKKP